MKDNIRIDATVQETKTTIVDLMVSDITVSADTDTIVLRVNGKQVRTYNYMQAYRMGMIVG